MVQVKVSDTALNYILDKADTITVKMELCAS